MGVRGFMHERSMEGRGVRSVRVRPGSVSTPDSPLPPASQHQNKYGTMNTDNWFSDGPCDQTPSNSTPSPGCGSQAAWNHPPVYIP